MNQHIEHMELGQTGAETRPSPETSAIAARRFSIRRFLAKSLLFAAILKTQAACAGDEFTVGHYDEDAGGEDGEGGMMPDSGTDADADAGMDGGGGEGGDADAGTVYGFDNDPKKNACIKWLTMNGGVKVNASPDDNNCDPKPYGALPLAPSLDLGVWAKDVPNNNAIGFKSPYGITTYMTKCSPTPVPPNNSQMETLMLNGGYVSTTNASTLPKVDLVNASCANGAVYVMHIAP